MCRHYTPWDVSRSEGQPQEAVDDDGDPEEPEEREVEPVVGDD